MDDSAVFYAVTHRYTYVLSEKSFQLWHKNPTPFDPSTEPRLLETKDLALEEAWSIKPRNDQPLWLESRPAPLPARPAAQLSLQAAAVAPGHRGLEGQSPPPT